jgi:hypothetical protein
VKSREFGLGPQDGAEDGWQIPRAARVSVTSRWLSAWPHACAVIKPTVIALWTKPHWLTFFNIKDLKMRRGFFVCRFLSY